MRSVFYVILWFLITFNLYEDFPYWLFQNTQYKVFAHGHYNQMTWVRIVGINGFDHTYYIRG